MAKRSPLSEIVEGISAIASLTTAAERIVEQLAARAMKPGPEDAEAASVQGPEPARSPRTGPRREKAPRAGSPTTRAKAAKVTIELAEPASEGLRVVFALRRGHVTATWTWDELVALLGDEGTSHFLDALDRADPRNTFDEPDEHEGNEHLRLRLRERP